MENLTPCPRTAIGGDAVKESHQDIDESPPVIKIKRISYPANIDFIEDLPVPEAEEKDKDNTQVDITHQQQLATFSSVKPPSQSSRLPTPRGIPIPLPHSNSFFSNLAKFSAKTRNTTSPPVVGQNLRRISGHIAPHPRFLTRDSNIGILDPASSIGGKELNLLEKTRRKSNFKVAQHKLMAPLDPPPIPRSKTLGALPVATSPTVVSPSTPRYALPTNASRARSKTPTSDPATTRGSFWGSAGMDSPVPSLPRRNRPRPSAAASGMLNRALATPSAVSTSRSTTSFLSPQTPRNPESTKKIQVPKPGELFKLGAHTYQAQPRTPTSVQPLAPPTNPAKKPLYLSITPTARKPGGPALITISQSMAQSPSPNISTISLYSPSPSSPSPSTPTPSIQVPNPISTPTADTADPRYVTTAQPPSYWLGRYTSLSNRFRTESLSLTVPRGSLRSPSAGDSVAGFSTIPTETAAIHQDTEGSRTRRVFAHLNSFCLTPEARASLAEFRIRLEKRLAVESKSAEADGKVDFVASSSSGEKNGGKGKGRDGARGVKDAGRDKRGVFERLMNGRVLRERGGEGGRDGNGNGGRDRRQTVGGSGSGSFGMRLG